MQKYTSQSVRYAEREPFNFCAIIYYKIMMRFKVSVSSKMSSSVNKILKTACVIPARNVMKYGPLNVLDTLISYY